MSYIDDFLAHLFGKAEIPRQPETYQNSTTDMPRGPVTMPEAPRGVNAGVNEIPLPSYLQDRPGPEKYAYVLEHLHDQQDADMHGQEAVTEIPWNKLHVEAIGTDRAAKLAEILAAKARRQGGPQWEDAGPGVKTFVGRPGISALRGE